MGLVFMTEGSVRGAAEEVLRGSPAFALNRGSGVLWDEGAVWNTGVCRRFGVRPVGEGRVD